MLASLESRKVSAKGSCFAIVASKYNARYVDAMVKAARAELKRAGARGIEVIRVPGAFEIPTVAASLASVPSGNAEKRFDALLCFGVVFQGQTSHAQHIGWAVTHALAEIQIQHKMPVIHGVFVFEKEEQARVRCLGKKHNRGTEAATTAIEMASVMKNLRNSEK
jgi:6,7-dimethyl-8-ribityllumazine synthase